MLDKFRGASLVECFGRAGLLENKSQAISGPQRAMPGGAVQAADYNDSRDL